MKHLLWVIAVLFGPTYGIIHINNYKQDNKGAITESVGNIVTSTITSTDLKSKHVTRVSYKKDKIKFTHDDYLLARLIRERYSDTDYSWDLKLSHYINLYTKGLVWPSPLDVASIIEIESQYNPHAISNCGAKGLMQISPLWRDRIPSSAFQSVRFNVKYGIKILSHYYKRYNGNQSAAILSYNSGNYAYNAGKAWPVYWYRYENAHMAFSRLYQLSF